MLSDLVRHVLRYTPLHRVGGLIQLPHPSGSCIRKRIGIRQVRFDVQHRRTIQKIDPAHRQCSSGDTDQLTISQRKIVGTVWRPRGEHPSLGAIARREDLGLPAPCLIEHRDHPDTVEPGEVFQSLLVVPIRKQFDGRLMFAIIHKGLTRRVVLGGIRRPDNADGFKGERHQAVPMDSVRITPPKFSMGRPRTLSRPPSPNGMV